MSTRYVKVKRYKKTIGKACIVHGCTKSALVTAVNKNKHMSMPVAFCVNHAAERGIVDAA